MRYITLIFITLGIQFTAACQVFNTSFELSSNAAATLNIQIIDSNNFMLFPATFGSGKLNFSSVRINNQGNVLSHKDFIDSSNNLATGWANSTNNTSDGGFIMGGGLAIGNQDRGLLIKFNSNGDTLWTKQFGDTTNFRTFRQALQTNESGYIAVGQYVAVGQRSDGWLVKTDSLGNLEWEKYYSVSLGTLERLSSVFQCSDGGYILGGIELEFPNQNIRNYDPIVIKVDSLGNQQWRYKHDTPANDANAYAIQTQDGNFVFSTSISIPEPAPYNQVSDSRAALVKLDQSGNFMWEKQYGHVASNHGLLVVKELPNGNLIATGRRRDNIDYTLEGLIVKTKANGDSIWIESYENDPNGIDSQNYLWDIVQLPDGGFMAAGEVIAIPPHVPFRQDPWIIRVDSNGCNMQSCLVDIDELASHEENLKLSIYPNPGKDFLNLELWDKSIQVYEIQVLNLIGQKQRIETIETRQHKRVLEIANLKPGVYLLQIISDKGVLVRKFVKE